MGWSVLCHAGQFEGGLVSSSHHACKPTNRQATKNHHSVWCGPAEAWQSVSYGAVLGAVRGGHNGGLLLVRTSAYTLNQSLLATAAVSRLWPTGPQRIRAASPGRHDARGLATGKGG